MSDEYVDPSGNTQQFRAFVEQRSAEPESRSKAPYLLAGGVLALFAVAVVVALLVARG